MTRLVRWAIGISAALALGSAAQAQVRAVPYTPLPVPLPLPMPIPMSNVGLTGSSLTIAPAPNVVVTIPSSTTLPAPVQVVPPPPPPEEPPPDGEEHCEDRDGNALNDPDDCTGGSLANTANSPADEPVNMLDDAQTLDSANASAVNTASEPAAPGWRPSWWMIVLGTIAVLILYGWIRDAIRRR